jgi:hypothetical protein
LVQIFRMQEFIRNHLYKNSNFDLSNENTDPDYSLRGFINGDQILQSSQILIPVPIPDILYAYNQQHPAGH